MELGRNCLGAGFQYVEYLCASSARRNRGQVAQPTHLVDELTRRRPFIVENIFALKVICNQSHLYRKNGEVAVTSVKLTQLEYNMQ